MFGRIVNRIKWQAMSGDAYARSLGVAVGQGCRILTRDFGSEPFLISIGDDVTISSDVTFINHDGSAWLVRDERGRRYLFQRITIGSHVFVGARVVLLPGVAIGDRVIVGAGSVVTRSVPPDSVVAGNPARWIRPFSAIEARFRTLPSEADLGPMRDDRARALAAVSKERRPLLHKPDTIPAGP